MCAPIPRSIFSIDIYVFTFNKRRLQEFRTVKVCQEPQSPLQVCVDRRVQDSMKHVDG